MARKRRRALIVGGSLGGLFAAHLLRSIGWEADVFERTVGDLSDRGAGIGTHGALLRILRRAGLAFDPLSGTTPKAYVCLDRDNRLVHAIEMRRTMTAWSHLYRPLRDALPPAHYFGGVGIERFAADDRGVTADFTDGARTSADLLIGADGVRSSVRGQLVPDLKPAYAGYIAWRALAPQGDIPAVTWAEICERYVFCLPDGEMLVSYPVPTRESESDRGRHSYNVVWYRPADADTLARLCTDAAGRRHDSIPPPLLRAEVVADMKACARALLAPPIAAVIEHTRQPFFQPIYDLASPQLAFGRVALLGDAAFVARPHVGAGVTKAALDALALAEAIADAGDDLDAALLRYDREQRRLGDWMVARGRQMGASIRTRPQGEAAPSQRQRDDRCRSVMGDYIAAASDIEALTARTAQPRAAPMAASLDRDEY
jgi:2-polyprenyl-6-methoxyphenol hydroxylase-like FAD-dependent oxidoreductase